MNPATWANAKSDCESYTDGHLATVDNDDVREVVEELMTSSDVGVTWIGLRQSVDNIGDVNNPPLWRYISGMKQNKARIDDLVE